MGVVLEEHGDGLAEVVQLQGADVLTVDQDLACCDVVQSDSELQDGALSGPVCSYDDLRWHSERRIVPGARCGTDT